MARTHAGGDFITVRTLRVLVPDDAALVDVHLELRAVVVKLRIHGDLIGVIVDAAAQIIFIEPLGCQRRYWRISSAADDNINLLLSGFRFLAVSILEGYCIKKLTLYIGYFALNGRADPLIVALANMDIILIGGIVGLPVP